MTLRAYSDYSLSQVQRKIVVFGRDRLQGRLARRAEILDSQDHAMYQPPKLQRPNKTPEQYASVKADRADIASRPRNLYNRMKEAYGCALQTLSNSELILTFRLPSRRERNWYNRSTFDHIYVSRTMGRNSGKYATGVFQVQVPRLLTSLRVSRCIFFQTTFPPVTHATCEFPRTFGVIRSTQ